MAKTSSLLNCRRESGTWVRIPVFPHSLNLMELYIVRIDDNIFEYDYISDYLSILQLNNHDKLSLFPKLNGNDYNTIKYNGGTLLYRSRSHRTAKYTKIYLVNIYHQQDSNNSNEIINDIIIRIKRDMKLNLFF